MSLEERLRTFTDADDSRGLRVAASLRIAELEAALRKTVPILHKGTSRGDDYADELDALKREIEALLANTIPPGVANDSQSN